MRCNEYRKTGIAGRNTIEFRFAAPPSGVRICLGDVDPMTGNSLEELTFEDEMVFEKDPRFACPAAEGMFPGEESDDTEALREFAKTLPGGCWMCIR